MKLIVCLDDNNGMMFNHRRQSRDRVLIADMISYVGDTPLWISPDSAPLFGEDCKSLLIDPQPAAAAGENDYCFVEDTPLPPDLGSVSELVIYRWNRHYPADRYFDLKPEAMGFQLIEQREFAGNSHEKITKEVYVK